MEQEIKLEPSEELAYWIGVVQSDGWIYHYKSRPDFEVGLRVGKLSLPMILKFQELSRKLFERKATIWKLKEKEIWETSIGVKTLLGLFVKLDIRFGDPPKPPIWCSSKPEFFGAYLAGVIDGDGDIRIKRPKYPQCAIRITSGTPQILLKEAIKETLKCGVSITHQSGVRKLGDRKIDGKWCSLEFVVSKKTRDFIEKHILPEMTLEHKIKTLSGFLSN